MGEARHADQTDNAQLLPPSLIQCTNEFFIMMCMFEEKQSLQTTPYTALTTELEDEASRNWSRRRRRVVSRVEQVRVGHKLAGNYTQLDVLPGISIFHLFIRFIFQLWLLYLNVREQKKSQLSKQTVYKASLAETSDPWLPVSKWCWTRWLEEDFSLFLKVNET